MCGPTNGQSKAVSGNGEDPSMNSAPPSLMARYTCASIMMAIFAVWGKYTFVPEEDCPTVTGPMHSYQVPAALTVGYLISLPLLRVFSERVFSKTTDVKLLLKESMVLYNVAQVLLNGWMVYKFIDALVNKGHPFVGDINTVHTGASYAVWVHYCDKYLEFFDTYFMVLRGKMDQVSFLHIYHHTTIAWAWWSGCSLFPGGDAYFGALLNSWIHVMMYSYYALSLLKISCPWKKYLTQAQLLQFASVIVYSGFSYAKWPTEIRNYKHTLAVAIQIFEMLSLFILFSQFYKKKYTKNKGDKSKGASSGKSTSSLTTNDDGDDVCQKAVKEITNSTSDMLETAAKDANKMMKSAKQSLTKANAIQSKNGVL
jgi:elongation of very long chain fatty acids protein 4